MGKVIYIDGHPIGEGYSPYVIAEMSANHNGSIDNAFRIINEAKNAGANAVKIQSYTPDTITLNSDREDFRIHGGLWDGRTLYDLYQEAYMPWDWHAPLFEFARNVGITIFSTPFDSSAVDMLEKHNAPAYKIASFEIVDLPLIKYVAQTGKPLIISTGMAGVEEIQEAIETAMAGGCKELAILHCVSGYPAPAAEYNLRTISDISQRFDLVTGISDHTLDNTVAITSVAMGAAIIEKHFTLNRNGGGPDDIFSLEPEGMRELCVGARTAWEALGQVKYTRKQSELSNVKFRRSLYFVKDLKAGDAIAEDAIRSVRPGYGIPPKYYEHLIGKKVLCDVRFGEAVRWEHVDRQLDTSVIK